MNKPFRRGRICSTNHINKVWKKEGMPRAKPIAVTFPEVLVWLDKEQVEYLNTLENPSEWIRKAIDEKRKREKTLSHPEVAED